MAQDENSSVDDHAKTARNLERAQHLASLGLTVDDALSAASFVKQRFGAYPAFDEAVDLCLEVKAKYPHSPVSEIFEAGLIAIETGFHDDPSNADAADFAKRIRAHVIFGKPEPSKP